MTSAPPNEPKSVTGLFIALAAVAVVIAFGGWYWHHAAEMRTSHIPLPARSLAVAPSGSPLASPAPEVSEEAPISMAVRTMLVSNKLVPKKGTTLTLCHLAAPYAAVTVAGNSTGNGTYWLKDASGTWTVAWEGANSATAAVATSTGFPADFSGSCADTRLLYTY